MPTLANLKTQTTTLSGRVTGTSYNSRPAVEPPSEVYRELGSQRGSMLVDVVPELVSPALANRTYKRMIRGDVSVRISLRSGKSPVLGGDYYVDPYNSDAKSVEIAEFVNANLFCAPKKPWLATLWDILHMFEYANSVMEPVFALREWAPKKTTPTSNRKNYTMIDKLAYRPASTIVSYNYDDNGGPESVTHNAVRADGKVEKIDLDIDKLLIFGFEGDGDSLQGQSLLRPAYEHWYYKHTLYKIDAIQKERHGIGVPDIELQPGYTPADKKVANELGRNLRTNEYSYIVRPPNVKVGFAELSGNLVNALESASHHDLMIMKNVLIQFLQADVTGGRATSATAADMFLKSMRYIGSYICAILNQYLVPKIVMYNYDTDEFPEVKVRNIGEVKDLQMWAAATSNLVDKNIITMDDETEAFCREIVQFPKKLGKRPPSTDGPSNVKQQYLLRDNPDTAGNEDLAGQAAVDAAKAKAALTTKSVGRPETTGNINAGTLSGA